MPLPELSAILVTRDTWTTLGRALHYLQRQTVAGGVEVVIVAARAADVALPPAVTAGFHSVQLVAVDSIGTREQAGAAGVRAAHAPVIVFVEDHVFVAPDWAAALIAAHQGPWAAVGPLVYNACPGALSLVCHLTDYGLWTDPAQAGPVPLLSNSNTAYKRDLLQALPGALEDWLDHQSQLQAHLLAQGRPLLFEPRARLWHLNFSHWPDGMRLRFAAGWSFGAGRSARWPVARRLLYVVAWPLILLVNLRRLLGLARRTGAPGGALARLLPALVALVALEALGEVCGYFLVPTAAEAYLHEVEFDRLRFISAHDRQTLDQTLARHLPPLPVAAPASAPQPA